MRILHQNIELLVSSCRHNAVACAMIIDMKVRYSYRIYPTDRQARELSKLFGYTRVLTTPRSEDTGNLSALSKIR